MTNNNSNNKKIIRGAISGAVAGSILGAFIGGGVNLIGFAINKATDQSSINQTDDQNRQNSQTPGILPFSAFGLALGAVGGAVIQARRNSNNNTMNTPPIKKQEDEKRPEKITEPQIIALSLLGEAINKYGTDIEQLPNILSSALSTWIGTLQEWKQNPLVSQLEKTNHVEDNDSVILVYTIPAHQEKIKSTRADIRIFLLDYLPTVKGKEEKAVIYKEPIVNITEYGFKND